MRSPDKSLFVLRKGTVLCVGLGPWRGQDGVGGDDERGGCGSYGERTGRSRVDQDLRGPETRTGRSDVRLLAGPGGAARERRRGVPGGRHRRGGRLGPPPSLAPPRSDL